MFRISTWEAASPKNYYAKSIPSPHRGTDIFSIYSRIDSLVFFPLRFIFFLRSIRKEGQRKSEGSLKNSCRNSWKRRGLGYRKLIHILTQLTILWYAYNISTSPPSSLFYLSFVDMTVFWRGILSVADPTKARSEAMHETRTIWIGEFIEAWTGDAERNGRKDEDGNGRSRDAKIQSPAYLERVWTQWNLFPSFCFPVILALTDCVKLVCNNLSTSGTRFHSQRKSESPLQKFKNLIYTSKTGLLIEQNSIKRFHIVFFTSTRN